MLSLLSLGSLGDHLLPNQIPCARARSGRSAFLALQDSNDVGLSICLTIINFHTSNSILESSA